LLQSIFPEILQLPKRKPTFCRSADFHSKSTISVARLQNSMGHGKLWTVATTAILQQG